MKKLPLIMVSASLFTLVVGSCTTKKASKKKSNSQEISVEEWRGLASKCTYPELHGAVANISEERIQDGKSEKGSATLTYTFSDGTWTMAQEESDQVYDVKYMLGFRASECLEAYEETLKVSDLTEYNLTWKWYKDLSLRYTGNVGGVSTSTDKYFVSGDVYLKFNSDGYISEVKMDAVNGYDNSILKREVSITYS